MLPFLGRPSGWDLRPGPLAFTSCDFSISAITIISTTPAGTNGNGSATNGHASNGHRPAMATATQAASYRPPAQRPGQPGVIQLLREADAAERHQSTTTQSPAGAIEAPSRGGFRPEQIAALSAPLDRARICSREQGRGRVNYLQGWVLIEEANRIFGHDGWQRQDLSCQCVTQAQQLIGSKSEGRPQKEGWGVTYIARVRITVHAGERGLLIREGTGAGHGIDVDLGLAHESAIKEAETDAM
ncbi:MAG: Rad52/Rad22 family DNA repair protein [Cyanobium sp.]